MDKSGQRILTYLQYKQRNSKPHWCMKLSVMGPEVSRIIISFLFFVDLLIFNPMQKMEFLLDTIICLLEDILVSK